MGACKKAIIAGYFGYDNAGDEIILRNLLAALHDKLPEVELVVLVKKPSKYSTQFKEKAVFKYRYNPVSIAVGLWSASVLLMGGGSLLQDRSGYFSIYYYLLLMAAAKLFRKKLIIFNQGIGPVENRVNRLLMKIALRNSDLIIVRDDKSADFLKNKLNIKKDIEIGADLVFYRYHSIRRLASVPTAGFSMRDWGRYGFKKEIDRFARWLIKEEGYECVNLNLHRDDDETDIKSLDSFKWGRIEDVEDKIASLSLLVGMRLHALMLGVLSGVPTIGVNYDPKVEYFCRFMGIPYLEKYDVKCSRLRTIYREVAGVSDNREERIAILSGRLENSLKILQKYCANAI